MMILLLMLMLLPLNSFALDEKSYAKGCIDAYHFLISQSGHKLSWEQNQDIIYGCANAATVSKMLEEAEKEDKEIKKLKPTKDDPKKI